MLSEKKKILIDMKYIYWFTIDMMKFLIQTRVYEFYDFKY